MTSLSGKPHTKINSRAAQKVASILLGIILVIASCYMGFLVFLAVIFLGTGHGFFGTTSRPEYQVYFLIIATFVALFGSTRAIRGRLWNGIGFSAISATLFPLLTDVLVSSDNHGHSPIDDNSLRIFLIFASLLAVIGLWTLLYFYKTRLAFILSWPVISAVGIWVVAPDLIEATSWVSVVILIALSVVPFIVALLGKRASRYWRYILLVVICIAVYAFHYTGDVSNFAQILPTSYNASTNGDTAQIKAGVITKKAVDGTEFTLIEHQHYSLHNLEPQAFPHGVLIPYKQPGTSCNSWVAVKPGTTSIMWSLIGENDDDCYPDSFVSSPSDDVVAYQDSYQMRVKQISTGKILMSEEDYAETNIVMQNGIVYFIDADSGSSNEPFTVKAFSLKQKKVLWQKTINETDNIIGFSPDSNTDVFKIVNNQLVLELNWIKTPGEVNLDQDEQSGDIKDRYVRYSFDLQTGSMARTLDPPALNILPTSQDGYYIPQEDLGSNIKLSKNGKLDQPISRLHVKGRQITLPEACEGVPVESEGWVYCINETKVLYFHE